MKKLLTILSLFVSYLAFAQPQITLTQFSTGYSKVNTIENCGDNRLFFVQQGGKIFICDTNGVKKTTPFLDITNKVSQTGNEKGLLGLAFHPNYAQNGYFYVNYTATSGGATKIARYKVSSNPNVADASSELILLSIYQPYTNHNGGCVRFGGDGYLYVGMGDGGNAGDPGNRAQNKDSLLGKILRIDVDNPSGSLNYGIPSDNPFVGTGGRDEIWAIGMRNPWRFSFDRIKKDLWIGDVGQDDLEEIDFEPASSAGGLNYGWKCYEANVTYSTLASCPAYSATAKPIAVYSHSTSGNCSVTGGFVYRGAKYGKLYGYYLYTDYCSGIIWATKQNSNGTFTTYNLGTFTPYQYVTFGEDYRGELYLSEHTNGKIMKISEQTCIPTAAITENTDTIHYCSNGTPYTLHSIFSNYNTYQWLKDGVLMTNDTLANVSINSTGSYRVIVTNPSACSDTSSPVYFIPHSLPDISLSGLDTGYCSMDAAVTLTSTPAGGMFSNTPGLTGNIFDPSVAGQGSYTITYTYTDSVGCANSDTLSTNVNICAGINREGVSLTNVTLYPNPNTGSFSIDFNSYIQKKGLVTISGLTGQVLAQKEIEVINGRNQISFDAVQLKQGFYLLKLQVATIEVNKTMLIK